MRARVAVWGCLALVLALVAIGTAYREHREDERMRRCAEAIAAADGTTEHDVALRDVCWPATRR